jgi:hypothetical protein
MTRVPHSWTWARSDIRKFLNWWLGSGQPIVVVRDWPDAECGVAHPPAERWRVYPLVLRTQTNGTDVVEGAAGQLTVCHRAVGAGAVGQCHFAAHVARACWSWGENGRLAP